MATIGTTDVGEWKKHDGRSNPVRPGVDFLPRIAAVSRDHVEEKQNWQSGAWDWRWPKGGPDAGSIVEYQLREAKA